MEVTPQQEPPPKATLGWSHWWVAAAVAAGSAAACLFAVFVLPGLFGFPQWLQMGDAIWTVKSAQWVSWGGLGTVYSGNPLYIPLPGFLILLAPFVALGDHWGLVTSYPISLPHPSMWLVVAPVFAVTGSTAVLGVDYLADTLGVARKRRLALAVGVGVLVVVPTVAWAGHPEDLVSLALACTALALLLRGRLTGAALVLSVAVLVQPWAGLLVPVLVAATPAGRRLRAAVWSAALPGSCALLMMALDFQGTSNALLRQPMLGNGQRMPWWSLAGHMKLALDGGPMDVRVGSGTRSVAVLLAFAIAFWVARRPGPREIMLASSVVLLARGLFETQFWPWYLAPAAVLMALGAAAFSATPARWRIAALASFVVYGLSAAAYNGVSMPSVAALAVLLFDAGVALWCAGLQQGPADGPAAGADPGERRPALVGVKSRRAVPILMAMNSDRPRGASTWTQ